MIEFYKNAKDRSLSDNIIFACGAGFIITLLSICIATMNGWVEAVSPLEVFAVFTSYVCTILMAFERRLGYIVGIITTAAYTVFFWEESRGLAIFNLYLVFSLIYGWWYWGDDSNTKEITSASNRERFGMALFAAGIMVAYMLFMRIVFPNTIVDAFDVILMGLSGSAQLLLDRKKIDNWIVWIVINIISIPYFLYKGWYLVAFQYVFFLANAYISYRAWKLNKA